MSLNKQLFMFNVQNRYSDGRALRLYPELISAVIYMLTDTKHSNTIGSLKAVLRQTQENYKEEKLS